MKKLLIFCALPALILTLALTAFATEPAPSAPVPAEVRTAILSTGVPMAGKTIAETPYGESLVRAYRAEDGITSRLQEGASPDGNYTETFVWEKLEAGLWTAMSHTDLFAEGEQYRLQVVLTFSPTVGPFSSGFDVAADTSVTINGVSVTPAVQKEGEKLILTVTREFRALKAELTPVVSYDGLVESFSRDYNGETFFLKVKLEEQVEGMTYRFDWYRNGILIPDFNRDTVTLRNVADSGIYSCTVVAYPAEEPEAVRREFSAQPTERVSVEIYPAYLLLVIDDQEKNLFDPDPEFTYTITGDTFDPLTGAPEREEGEDVGEYPISTGTLSFGEENDGNYDIEVVEGLLSVLPIGQLPFSNVQGHADLTRILGLNGSSIRVMATRGAIPEGAILSLLPYDPALREALEAGDRNLMKAFAVSLTDDKGNPLELASHARFRFYIPLTSEEMQEKAETITAGLYINGLIPISVSVEGTAVRYMVVETGTLGVISLYHGEKEDLPVNGGTSEPTPPESEPTPEPDQGEKEPQDGSSPILWVILGILLLLAVGVVIFTLVAEKKPASGTAKRAGASVAAGRTSKKAAPSPKEEEEDEDFDDDPVPPGRVVSFEDLEDQ